MVTLYSNAPKTFFIQSPEKTVIYPLTYAATTNNYSYEYVYEQSPVELILVLEELYLRAMLQKLFFDSLLAEQSSRFISMDIATRNAENLLDVMKLDYNKLRQMMITRELADLTGSLL